MTRTIVMPVLFHGPRGQVGFDAEIGIEDDGTVTIVTRNDSQDQYRFTKTQLVEILGHVIGEQHSSVIREVYRTIVETWT